jgi:peptide/nickel transport system substrate-binding protein
MRKFYWYVTAYIRKHGWIVVGSVLGAITLFSFMVPNLANSLEKNKRFYVAVVGEFTLQTLPEIITNQLSVGLTSIEPDGSVLPLLAQRWTVEQEGAAFRFILRDDIFFNDGQKLEPKDIAYQLKDTQIIVNQNDVVFKLPGPYAPFPTVVAAPILKPGKIKHLFFFEKPSLVGIGPYKITSYKSVGNRLTELEVEGKNERYIYRFYLTEQDAITAYKHGKVDIVPDLAKLHDVMNWKNTSVDVELNSDHYLAVFFNIRNPLFEKNVRQGLNYALTKTDDSKRAYGPVNPKSWAYLDGAKGYEKDWQRASERMLDTLPSQPLNLELTTTSIFEKEAEEIKKEWEAFGQKVFADCQTSEKVKEKSECDKLKIMVTVKITNFPDTSSFQLLLIGQESPADPDQYSLWHSQQSTNFSGYKNTRIDSLLEKGRQTFDQGERREIYQEFQQFFLEDSPAIFLKYLDWYKVERQ